jgi:hypothetical protein
VAKKRAINQAKSKARAVSAAGTTLPKKKVPKSVAQRRNTVSQIAKLPAEEAAPKAAKKQARAAKRKLSASVHGSIGKEDDNDGEFVLAVHARGAGKRAIKYKKLE